MKHGYTNATVLDAGTVRKTYAGPDAAARQAREIAALTALQGHVPVPVLVGSGPGWIATGYVEGEHGQDLIDTGHAEDVLATCGEVLARLHGLDARLLDPAASAGAVIRHGDFGPNNILFTGPGREAVAVLDWEFCGTGAPLADVAWCEWIVRMHHPAAASALPAFFAAYGETPPWPERQAEMLRRCDELAEFCDHWNPGGAAVQTWRDRAEAVRGWSE